MLEEAGLADHIEVRYEEGDYNSDIEEGKVESQSVEGAVFNTLENRICTYDNGVRIGTQDDNVITLWLSKGQEAVKPTPAPRSSGGSDVDIDFK